MMPASRSAMDRRSDSRIWARSLTTTSSVVAALNSVLAGALASDVAVLLHFGAAAAVGLGAAVSIAAAILHVMHAARFRERHGPLENERKTP